MQDYKYYLFNGSGTWYPRISRMEDVRESLKKQDGNYHYYSIGMLEDSVKSIKVTQDLENLQKMDNLQTGISHRNHTSILGANKRDVDFTGQPVANQEDWLNNPDLMAGAGIDIGEGIDAKFSALKKKKSVLQKPLDIAPKEAQESAIGAPESQPQTSLAPKKIKMGKKKKVVSAHVERPPKIVKPRVRKSRMGSTETMSHDIIDSVIKAMPKK